MSGDVDGDVEAEVDLHMTCLACLREWKEVGANRLLPLFTCCGVVRVREVPDQLLFTDEGGAWTRRVAVSKRVRRLYG